MANLNGTPDNVVQLPVEQRFSCVLVFTSVNSGEQLMLVKVDTGSRMEMSRLADLLHNNPTMAIAKGMHLFGAALQALYKNIEITSTYGVAAV